MNASTKLVLWSLAALMLVATVPGCSGCRNPLIQRSDELRDIDDEEEGEDEEEKPKEDVEMLSAATVPGDDTSEGRPPLAKPGHWTSVVHEIRANNFDIQAELRTASTDLHGAIYPVENTQFELFSSFPAALPKGQLKVFNTPYYIPSLPSGKSVYLNRELRAARGGGLIGLADRVSVLPLRDYQYFFLVLASEPDRYGYLKVLTSIESPNAEADLTLDRLLHYRVLLPQIDRFAPLPSHSLTWSAIAYLLWDDVDVGTVTVDQQEALLDWLHWGGQIIVSGPNSLAKLQGSFLDPYLPAKEERSMELEQEAIDELNEHWSIVNRQTGESRDLKMLPGSPLVGVRLSNHADAQVVPHTAGLVTERRVGRGRIVVTAFSLTDQAILRWQSYDSFFNACLLRRPPRAFESRDTIAHTTWLTSEPVKPTDSRLISGLRYFSRDVGNNPHRAIRPATQGAVGDLQRLVDQKPERCCAAPGDTPAERAGGQLPR